MPRQPFLPAVKGKVLESRATFWKLLQPNYCSYCGGEIEQILVGYD